MPSRVRETEPMGEAERGRARYLLRTQCKPV